MLAMRVHGVRRCAAVFDRDDPHDQDEMLVAAALVLGGVRLAKGSAASTGRARKVSTGSAVPPQGWGLERVRAASAEGGVGRKYLIC